MLDRHLHLGSFSPIIHVFFTLSYFLLPSTSYCPPLLLLSYFTLSYFTLLFLVTKQSPPPRLKSNSQSHHTNLTEQCRQQSPLICLSYLDFSITEDLPPHCSSFPLSSTASLSATNTSEKRHISPTQPSTVTLLPCYCSSSTSINLQTRCSVTQATRQLRLSFLKVEEEREVFLLPVKSVGGRKLCHKEVIRSSRSPPG